MFQANIFCLFLSVMSYAKIQSRIQYVKEICESVTNGQSTNIQITPLIFTCSRSTTETLQKDVKYI